MCSRLCAIPVLSKNPTDFISGPDLVRILLLAVPDSLYGRSCIVKARLTYR